MLTTVFLIVTTLICVQRSARARKDGAPMELEGVEEVGKGEGEGIRSTRVGMNASVRKGHLRSIKRNVGESPSSVQRYFYSQTFAAYDSRSVSIGWGITGAVLVVLAVFMGLFVWKCSTGHAKLRLW